MNVLVGLVPAVGWGFQPLLSRKTGGRPVNQLIGTTLACFIIGCFIFVCIALSLTNSGYHLIEGVTFACNFIKGVLWCCGCICIFYAFDILGVAKTGPISTGVQLIYTTTMGIALFHENYNSQVPYQGILICIACMIVVMFGMILISWKPKNAYKKNNNATNLEHKKLDKKQILLLCLYFGIIMIGNGSFFIFSNIPIKFHDTGFSHIFNIQNITTGKKSYWDSLTGAQQNIYNLSCMFPLGIGMLTGGILFGLFFWIFPALRSKNKLSWQTANKQCPFIQPTSYYSIFAGIAFAVASLGYLYSSTANGTAIAALLGQFNVVILSVFGMIIFKEKMNKIEYILLFVGLGIVSVACVIPSFIPTFFPALK